MGNSWKQFGALRATLVCLTAILAMCCNARGQGRTLRVSVVSYDLSMQVFVRIGTGHVVGEERISDDVFPCTSDTLEDLGISCANSIPPYFCYGVGDSLGLTVDTVDKVLRNITVDHCAAMGQDHWTFTIPSLPYTVDSSGGIHAMWRLNDSPISFVYQGSSSAGYGHSGSELLEAPSFVRVGSPQKESVQVAKPTLEKPILSLRKLGEVLLLELRPSLQSGRVSIVNELGNSVLEERIPAGASSVQISVARLNRGVYFIRLGQAIERIVLNDGD